MNRALVTGASGFIGGVSAGVCSRTERKVTPSRAATRLKVVGAADIELTKQLLGWQLRTTLADGLRLDDRLVPDRARARETVCPRLIWRMKAFARSG